jgi:hypothetical protein
MMIYHAITALHLSAEEDGSLPGKGLTALQTILIYIGAPVALFIVISVIAYAATAPRRNKPSSLSHIE